jgi:hypothetical protein
MKRKRSFDDGMGVSEFRGRLNTQAIVFSPSTESARRKGGSLKSHVRQELSERERRGGPEGRRAFALYSEGCTEKAGTRSIGPMSGEWGVENPSRGTVRGPINGTTDLQSTTDLRFIFRVRKKSEEIIDD